MAKQIKCIRCKRVIEVDKVCQSCKNDLLYYYEATRDWMLAYELESQERYMSKSRFDSDISEFAF